MKPFPFSPRRVFIAVLSAIAALTILGWALWSMSATQYRRVIDGWIDSGRAAGYQISYDDRQVFGFPRRITMRFVNLHWKNADGIDFHTDDMDVTVTPWNWNDFEAKFKNHAVLAAPLDDAGKALTLSGSSGQAHVRLNEDGEWRMANVLLDDAQLGLAPTYLFRADRLTASVTRPDAPPKDHSDAGLTLEGEVDNVILPDAMPSPFGKNATKLAAHMRVMGDVPDVRKRAAVDAWNKNSGIVAFDDFTLQWGILDMTSKGTVGFDDDLQPEGAFVGTIANPEKTMHTLIDQGFIAMHDQTMLAAVMEMFAKPLPHGAKGLEMPITVQLGGLFFGPIRIFTFPQIEWPTEPPTLSN